VTSRGYANAVPVLDDSHPLLTMADVEALAERLGLVVVTDGKRFEYARPGLIPAGFRKFAMVQRSRPIDPKEPRS
jgi:hypothetical protein